MFKVKNCVGKDAFSRMNYLYQLSNIPELRNIAVSPLYADLIIRISRKSVQRLEPEIKRTICKKCHSLLIPGETCKVRVKRKIICWTCAACQTIRRFPANPDYKLWIENPDAVAETLNFSIKRQ